MIVVESTESFPRLLLGIGRNRTDARGLLAFPPATRWPELDGAVPGWPAAGAGHVRGRDEQDQPAAQPTAECFADQAAHPRTATSPAARRCSSVRPAEPVEAVNMTGWSLAALDRLPPVRGGAGTPGPAGTVRACRFGGIPGFGGSCTTNWALTRGVCAQAGGRVCRARHPASSLLEFNPLRSARGSSSCPLPRRRFSIFVVARFVARNGVLRRDPVCAVIRATCADGLGEHQGCDERISRNA